MSQDRCAEHADLDPRKKPLPGAFATVFVSKNLTAQRAPRRGNNRNNADLSCHGNDASEPPKRCQPREIELSCSLSHGVKTRLTASAEGDTLEVVKAFDLVPRESFCTTSH